jgi:hypothetical protein
MVTLWVSKFTYSKIYSVNFIVKILKPVEIRVIICGHSVELLYRTSCCTHRTLRPYVCLLKA